MLEVETRADLGIPLGLRPPMESHIRTPAEIAERKARLVREHHRTRTPGELLGSLGIFAWDSIEDLILSAAAFPPTNIMLVGEAGSGKSSACLKILSTIYGESQVRKVDTHIEDELSLGVCDVPNLAERKMDTLRSDASILEFRGVILDEFNRAREDLRKMYLPLLSERTVLGHRAKALTVIGTMNPLGEGYNTEPLDLAAAERFSQVIGVPEYHRVDESYRLKMLGSVAGRGSVESESGFSLEVTRALRAALLATQIAYDAVERSHLKTLIRYVDTVLLAAKQSTPPLQLQSTRTGKNLLRNILRLMAFHQAVYGEDPAKTIEPLAMKALNHVSTAELYGDPIPGEKLVAVHEKAKLGLSAKDAMLALVTSLKDPVEALAALLSDGAESIAEIDRSRLIEHHLKAIGVRCVDTTLSPEETAVLASDVAAVCLSILSSAEKLTDSVLVQASNLYRTFALPLGHSSGSPDGVLLSLTESLLSDAEGPGLQTYLTPLSLRGDYNVPLPVRHWQSGHALQIIEMLVDDTLATAGVDRGERERLVAEAVPARLAHWNRRRKYYDSL